MKKRSIRLKISAGGVLLLAALYFFLTVDELIALLLAAAVHEAGHILAIRLTGGQTFGITVGVTGAVITRSAPEGRAREAVCAISGPLSGLAYAVAAALLSSLIESEMLTLSSGMSMVLTVFNTLPVLPLDGGRAIACIIGYRPACAVSLVTASCVLLLGVILAASDYGFALLAAGAALMAQQARA